MLDKMIEMQAKIDALYKKLEIEIKTKKVLEEIGFSIREKGCVYLIFAVKTAGKNPNLLHQPQLLYEEIAQTCGVTSEEVENEIGHSITRWRQKESLSRLNGRGNAKYGLFTGFDSTNGEFIVRLAEIVLAEKNDRYLKNST